MADERERQIRERTEAVLALSQLDRSPLGQWPEDAAYLLDALDETNEIMVRATSELKRALADARKENGRLREVLTIARMYCNQGGREYVDAALAREDGHV